MFYSLRQKKCCQQTIAYKNTVAMNAVEASLSLTHTHACLYPSHLSCTHTHMYCTTDATVEQLWLEC